MLWRIDNSCANRRIIRRADCFCKFHEPHIEQWQSVSLFSSDRPFGRIRGTGEGRLSLDAVELHPRCTRPINELAWLTRACASFSGALHTVCMN